MQKQTLTHEEACRIARGGEGAIVGELLRLSKELTAANEHVKRLQESLEQQ